ncbi:MAG: KPN_02809 family neutral zinc metallopeptidase [Geminicoccaceae bacterium]
MRWGKGKRSANIEDRRGRRMGGKAAGGIGGIGLIVAVGYLLLSGDPSMLIRQIAGGIGGGQTQQTAPAQTSEQEEQVKDFISVVLADTEQVWEGIFKENGLTYQDPTLVLYTDQTPTACGTGQAAAGPFYCPGDRKLYLDLSFLGEMKRMGATGDFALAYVVAHEVGHHVQTLVGTADKVRQMQARSSQIESNQIQVAMELQADCLAGVWAHHAERQRQILEEGDIEEGIRAAAAVGDDHLQRMAGRRVVPEAFTHGSSEQRMDWLKRGLSTGDVQACNAFEA